MVNAIAFVLFCIGAVLEFIASHASPLFFGLAGLAILALAGVPFVINRVK